MYRLQRSCTLRSRAPNLPQSKEEVQYIKSVITDSLSSVQVKTRLACFSFLLLKFVFAAHFCASEFSLPELRLFVLLLRRTFFKNLQGLCIIRSLIFKVQFCKKFFGSSWLKPWFSLLSFCFLLSCFLRQLVYLNTRLWDCQAIFCLFLIFFSVLFPEQDMVFSFPYVVSISDKDIE